MKINGTKHKEKKIEPGSIVDFKRNKFDLVEEDYFCSLLYSLREGKSNVLWDLILLKVKLSKSRKNCNFRLKFTNTHTTLMFEKRLFNE